MKRSNTLRLKVMSHSGEWDMPPCGPVDPAKEPSQGIAKDHRAWPVTPFLIHNAVTVDSLTAQDFLCCIYIYKCIWLKSGQFLCMAQTHMYRVKESKHIKQNWKKKSVLKQTWTNKEPMINKTPNKYVNINFMSYLCCQHYWKTIRINNVLTTSCLTYTLTLFSKYIKQKTLTKNDWNTKNSWQMDFEVI